MEIMDTKQDNISDGSNVHNMQSSNRLSTLIKISIPEFLVTDAGLAIISTIIKRAIQDENFGFEGGDTSALSENPKVSAESNIDLDSESRERFADISSNRFNIDFNDTFFTAKEASLHENSLTFLKEAIESSDDIKKVKTRDGISIPSLTKLLSYIPVLLIYIEVVRCNHEEFRDCQKRNNGGSKKIDQKCESIEQILIVIKQSYGRYVCENGLKVIASNLLALLRVMIERFMGHAKSLVSTSSKNNTADTSNTSNREASKFAAYTDYMNVLASEMIEEINAFSDLLLKNKYYEELASSNVQKALSTLSEISLCNKNRTDFRQPNWILSLFQILEVLIGIQHDSFVAEAGTAVLFTLSSMNINFNMAEPSLQEENSSSVERVTSFQLLKLYAASTCAIRRRIPSTMWFMLTSVFTERSNLIIDTDLASIFGAGLTNREKNMIAGLVYGGTLTNDWMYIIPPGMDALHPALQLDVELYTTTSFTALLNELRQCCMSSSSSGIISLDNNLSIRLVKTLFSSSRNATRKGAPRACDVSTSKNGFIQALRVFWIGWWVFESFPNRIRGITSLLQEIFTNFPGAKTTDQSFGSDGNQGNGSFDSETINSNKRRRTSVEILNGRQGKQNIMQKFLGENNTRKDGKNKSVVFPSLTSDTFSFHLNFALVMLPVLFLLAKPVVTDKKDEKKRSSDSDTVKSKPYDNFIVTAQLFIATIGEFKRIIKNHKHKHVGFGKYCPTYPYKIFNLLILHLKNILRSPSAKYFVNNQDVEGHPGVN